MSRRPRRRAPTEPWWGSRSSRLSVALTATAASVLRWARAPTVVNSRYFASGSKRCCGNGRAVRVTKPGPRLGVELAVEAFARRAPRGPLGNGDATPGRRERRGCEVGLGADAPPADRRVRPAACLVTKIMTAVARRQDRSGSSRAPHASPARGPRGVGSPRRRREDALVVTPRTCLIGGRLSNLLSGTRSELMLSVHVDDGGVRARVDLH